MSQLWNVQSLNCLRVMYECAQQAVVYESEVQQGDLMWEYRLGGVAVGVVTAAPVEVGRFPRRVCRAKRGP